MVRPRGSEQNKRIACFFAETVTMRRELNDLHQSEEEWKPVDCKGKNSIFAILAQCMPSVVRHMYQLADTDIRNRTGITEIELNKSLVSSGHGVMRQRYSINGNFHSKRVWKGLTWIELSNSIHLLHLRSRLHSLQQLPEAQHLNFNSIIDVLSRIPTKYAKIHAPLGKAQKGSSHLKAIVSGIKVISGKSRKVVTSTPSLAFQLSFTEKIHDSVTSSPVDIDTESDSTVNCTYSAPTLPSCTTYAASFDFSTPPCKHQHQQYIESIWTQRPLKANISDIGIASKHEITCPVQYEAVVTPASSANRDLTNSTLSQHVSADRSHIFRAIPSAWYSTGSTPNCAQGLWQQHPSYIQQPRPRDALAEQGIILDSSPLLHQASAAGWGMADMRRLLTFGYSAEEVMPLLSALPPALAIPLLGALHSLDAMHEASNARAARAASTADPMISAPRGGMLGISESCRARHFASDLSLRCEMDSDENVGWLEVHFDASTQQRTEVYLNQRYAQLLGWDRRDLLSRFSCHGLPLPSTEADFLACFLHDLLHRFSPDVTQYVRVATRRSSQSQATWGLRSSEVAEDLKAFRAAPEASRLLRACTRKTFDAWGRIVKVTTALREIAAADYDAILATRPSSYPLFCMIGDGRPAAELLVGLASELEARAAYAKVPRRLAASLLGAWERQAVMGVCGRNFGLVVARLDALAGTAAELTGLRSCGP